MNIGDKVRFLNDVGGGKVTGFRSGGIVLVEDAEGFDIPMPQNEVVVIEDNAPKVEKKKLTPKMTFGMKPSVKSELEEKQESRTFNGRQYLQSKTVVSVEEEVDEQLEARVMRLEQTLQSQMQTLQQMKETLQKADERIALLEAENNLRKNERLMKPKPQPKPKSKPEMPKTIGDLQIL